MIIEIPIAYINKPNLNGYYISEEVYRSALNDEFKYPAPVTFQDSSEIIGECIHYDLENHRAKINIYDSVAIKLVEKYLSDKYLGYRLTADTDDIITDENGNKVVLNAKLLGFDIIDQPAYVDDDNLYNSIREFIKQQKPIAPEEYSKINDYIKSNSISTGVSIFDYMDLKENNND